jgi:poly(beta-D-mannuronate) lyase
MLYINNLDENFQSIKIYSMDGKELLEKKVTHSNEELSIDLSFLAKGTYMISLNKGINSITKMIVVD